MKFTGIGSKFTAAEVMGGKLAQPITGGGQHSFACRDCNLTFKKFQGLWGHRKLHTKAMEPNQKPRRRHRRKIQNYTTLVVASEGANISQKPLEKEEWHTVEVKTSFHGTTNGSSTMGKFIEFMEINRTHPSMVPAMVETRTARVTEELDLTFRGTLLSC